MRFTKVSLGIPSAVILLACATSVAWGQQQQTQQPQQQRPRTGAPAQPAAAQPAAGQPAARPGQPAAPPNAKPPIVTASGQAAPKPQRPAAEALVLEELPPELEDLLKEWEVQSSTIKTLHGKHTRVIYNTVFEVEKIAEGKFYLETPDKGRIDLVGITPKKGEVSQKIGENGKPFRLEPDRAEKWICNGKAIFAVNEAEKTFEFVPIPPEHQGANIVNSPLPFLFGMKAQDMKRRFRIVLNANYKRKDKIAHLVVYPRQDIDRKNYSKAHILLDTTKFLPTAVKLLDENSHLETVYQFKEVVINEPAASKSILPKIFPEQDPFNPNFKKEGYKLVLAPTDVPDQRPSQAEPVRPKTAQAVPNGGTPQTNPRPPVAPPRGTPSKQ